jgi:hypothetical protein
MDLNPVGYKFVYIEVGALLRRETPKGTKFTKKLNL